jgi:hypothetical protein
VGRSSLPAERSEKEQEISRLFLAGLAGDDAAHRAFLGRAAVHLRAFFAPNCASAQKRRIWCKKH